MQPLLLQSVIIVVGEEEERETGLRNKATTTAESHGPQAM